MTEDVLLYWDEDAKAFVSTHSMLKTFRRCPKQFQYKYVERLKPRVLGRPLRFGTWMHRLQEAHGKGEDWREVHEELTSEWHKLFDEEKEWIGDLPRDCYRMFKSYLWHYASDNWRLLDTEFVLEVELPDGNIFRCKIDNLIEDQYGLWVVDHKWHKRLPNHDYRVLDAQSGDYIWACWKNGIPVQGHQWNYGLSKPPTIPTLIQSGARVSRWDRVDTDYPTAARFFKEHPELSLGPYKQKLRRLKAQQYKFGEVQSSNFFKRVVIEKNRAMISQVAREMYHTHKRMHAYPWYQTQTIERVPDRSCTFMCSFTDICSGELVTGRRPINWQQRYSIGDPLEYYNDDKVDPNKET